MIASPIARAVASAVAAMIAGRIARIETAIVARSGFSPSATAPSCQERGTEPSASVISAVMIGVIITRENHHRDEQARAGELDHVDHRCLLARADQVVADERHQHEDADQAVDDGRDRRQQADHRRHQALRSGGGAKSTMKIAVSTRDGQPEDHREPCSQQRAVDQRPRAEVVGRRRRVGRRVRPSRRSGCRGCRPEPSHDRPSCEQRRPRALGDEDDHQDDRDRRSDMRPRRASARRGRHSTACAAARARLPASPGLPARSCQAESSWSR